MRSMCVGVAETGHRGSDTYADGAIKITLISLCSHPDAHPNLNREVRHSLTWHSSESESALERFEPVAVVQRLPDGRGILFAPVAARRQGEFSKRGELTNAHSALVGVAETGVNALFDDFWYFWSYKSTRNSELFLISLRVNAVSSLQVNIKSTTPK